MKSTRFTLIEDEDMILDLEYSDQYFILHLPLFTPKKSSVQRLRVKLEELKEFADTIGYTGVYAAIGKDDKPMHKLVRLLYFKHIGENEGLDIFAYVGET